jgi:hypothetical protein
MAKKLKLGEKYINLGFEFIFEVTKVTRVTKGIKPFEVYEYRTLVDIKDSKSIGRTDTFIEDSLYVNDSVRFPRGELFKRTFIKWILETPRSKLSNLFRQG